MNLLCIWRNVHKPSLFSVQDRIVWLGSMRLSSLCQEFMEAFFTLFGGRFGDLEILFFLVKLSLKNLCCLIRWFLKFFCWASRCVKVVLIGLTSCIIQSCLLIPCNCYFRLTYLLVFIIYMSF